MVKNKTEPTAVAVDEFVAGVENPKRQADALVVLEMMRRITGEEGTMWGPSIAGFGSYHYKYESGHEGDAAVVGFSPRKANLAFYGLTWQPEAEELLPRLGKFKTGVACLYINKLADVDQAVLEELIRTGYQHKSSCSA